MLSQVTLQDVTDTLSEETLPKTAIEVDAIKSWSFRMTIKDLIELGR